MPAPVQGRASPPRGGKCLASPPGGCPGVLPHPTEPGMLELAPALLERLLCDEPIQSHLNVEPRPFARGKFASVRKAWRTLPAPPLATPGGGTGTLEVYAAKYQRKQRRGESVRHAILHEAAVLYMLRHETSVVQLRGLYETPAEMILLLELAPHGEVQRLLDESSAGVGEALSRSCLTHTLGALLSLHSRNIAHLDVKPQNLLLMAPPCGGGCEVKLCDFGIAREMRRDVELREVLGTPDYVAPEVLQYEPISLATDMWSVGILAYVLLSGHSPFAGDTKQETFLNISQGELVFPEDLFEDVSEPAKQFITGLVQLQAESRLTVQEALQHPWLSTGSVRTPDTRLLTAATTAPADDADEAAAVPADDADEVAAVPADDADEVAAVPADVTTAEQYGADGMEPADGTRDAHDCRLQADSVPVPCLNGSSVSADEEEEGVMLERADGVVEGEDGDGGPQWRVEDEVDSSAGCDGCQISYSTEADLNGYQSQTVVCLASPTKPKPPPKPANLSPKKCFLPKPPLRKKPTALFKPDQDVVSSSTSSSRGSGGLPARFEGRSGMRCSPPRGAGGKTSSPRLQRKATDGGASSEQESSPPRPCRTASNSPSSRQTSSASPKLPRKSSISPSSRHLPTSPQTTRKASNSPSSRLSSASSPLTRKSSSSPKSVRKPGMSPVSPQLQQSSPKFSKKSSITLRLSEDHNNSPSSQRQISSKCRRKRVDDFPRLAQRADDSCCTSSKVVNAPLTSRATRISPRLTRRLEALPSPRQSGGDSKESHHAVHYVEFRLTTQASHASLSIPNGVVSHPPARSVSPSPPRDSTAVRCLGNAATPRDSSPSSRHVTSDSDKSVASHRTADSFSPTLRRRCAQSPTRHLSRQLQESPTRECCRPADTSGAPSWRRRSSLSPTRVRKVFSSPTRSWRTDSPSAALKTNSSLATGGEAAPEFLPPGNENLNSSSPTRSEKLPPSPMTSPRLPRTTPAGEPNASTSPRATARSVFSRNVQALHAGCPTSQHHPPVSSPTRRNFQLTKSSTAPSQNISSESQQTPHRNYSSTVFSARPYCKSSDISTRSAGVSTSAVLSMTSGGDLFDPSDVTMQSEESGSSGISPVSRKTPSHSPPMFQPAPKKSNTVSDFHSSYSVRVTDPDFNAVVLMEEHNGGGEADTLLNTNRRFQRQAGTEGCHSEKTSRRGINQTSRAVVSSQNLKLSSSPPLSLHASSKTSNTALSSRHLPINDSCLKPSPYHSVTHVPSSYLASHRKAFAVVNGTSSGFSSSPVKRHSNSKVVFSTSGSVVVKPQPKPRPARLTLIASPTRETEEASLSCPPVTSCFALLSSGALASPDKSSFHTSSSFSSSRSSSESTPWKGNVGGSHGTSSPSSSASSSLSGPEDYFSNKGWQPNGGGGSHASASAQRRSDRKENNLNTLKTSPVTAGSNTASPGVYITAQGSDVSISRRNRAPGPAERGVLEMEVDQYPAAGATLHDDDDGRMLCDEDDSGRSCD